MGVLALMANAVMLHVLCSGIVNASLGLLVTSAVLILTSAHLFLVKETPIALTQWIVTSVYVQSIARIMLLLSREVSRKSKKFQAA